MCTAMTMQTLRGDTFFGRTMDFSYPLHPELFIIQKGYEWDNALKTHRIYNQYSFMGIGQDLSPVTLLRSIQIVGTKDSVTNSVSTLHWMIADKDGTCMVV